jgi:hypothetical protein
METLSVRERLRMTINNAGVAEVVLDRPPANAIDFLTLAELKQAAQVLSVDRSVRAVLLSSALEPIFAGGFDLDFLAHGWDDMLPMIRAFHEVANAWVRIPSPTIAVFNVRLGRWMRHPLDIVLRKAKLKEAEEPQFWRIPRPQHLLYEAFSKTGLSVERLDGKRIRAQRGFVFLTDGGHIDNLGIYELLRRRCKLIIAIDGEADPDFDSGSLVQVERFARIDLNVIIRTNCEPIDRTQAVTNEIKTGQLKNGRAPMAPPGSISYPPLTGGDRRRGDHFIWASLGGDESDYVIAYKKANPDFPHETTLDQLFSEEQFEAYRALGEHIARRFLDGRDSVAVYSDEKEELLKIVRAMLPEATPK